MFADRTHHTKNRMKDRVNDPMNDQVKERGVCPGIWACATDWRVFTKQIFSGGFKRQFEKEDAKGRRKGKTRKEDEKGEDEKKTTNDYDKQRMVNSMGFTATKRLQSVLQERRCVRRGSEHEKVEQVDGNHEVRQLENKNQIKKMNKY